MTRRLFTGVLNISRGLRVWPSCLSHASVSTISWKTAIETGSVTSPFELVCATEIRAASSMPSCASQRGDSGLRRRSAGGTEGEQIVNSTVAVQQKGRGSSEFRYSHERQDDDAQGGEDALDQRRCSPSPGRLPLGRAEGDTGSDESSDAVKFVSLRLLVGTQGVGNKSLWSVLTSKSRSAVRHPRLATGWGMSPTGTRRQRCRTSQCRSRG